MIWTLVQILFFLIIGGMGGGMIGMAVGMWRDKYSDTTLKVVAALIGSIGVLILLVLLGLGTGQIKLGNLPDGCYQVDSELGVIPAGKTVFLYNDREYTPIACP